MQRPFDCFAEEAANTRWDAIVVGAGLTGLAIAHRLGRGGKKILVLESSRRIGGVIHSERIDGYLCEAGPSSMLVKSPEVRQWLDELGLQDRLVAANPKADKRFLVRRGKLLAMPASPLAAIATPLYSWPAKLRLLAEPFIGKSTLDDESVASFVRRRMGWEFLDYGISALVSGIFAGDPERLSLRHAFPKVWNLEQNYGSLIGGSLKLRRERKRKGIPAFKSQLLSFKGGLEELPIALADKGSFEVATAAQIVAIHRHDSNWLVDVADKRLKAAECIITCPLDAYGALPVEENLGVALSRLPIIPHPPLSTLVMGFDRSQISHPLDGFGGLFPFREQRFCLGAIFSSTLFPGRAPADKVCLMAFIGGQTQPDHATLPMAELLHSAVEDLRPLLGIVGMPEFHRHTFWPAAIPQYDLGHQQLLDAIAGIESEFPGLHIHGNFRGGPGLNDRLLQALSFDRPNGQ